MRVGIIGHPLKIKNVMAALKAKKDFVEIVTLTLATTELKDVERVCEFQKKVDFIIFCGVYDYMYFLKKIELERFAGYIKNDITALCITLIGCTMHGIALESISIDGYDTMDIEYLCDELGVKRAQIFKGIYNYADLVDDTEAIMEEISMFHYNMFISGKVKVCITCMTPVYERLKSLMVNCILVKNTHESIRSEYERIKYKYLLERKERKEVIALEVKIIDDFDDNILVDDIGLIRENAKIIQELLLLVKKMKASIDIISSNHYIIFTELKSFEEETESYTNFSSFSSIKSWTNSRICIGMGFGENLAEIRKNARKGLSYATKENKSCIYLCYDSFNVEGPIGLQWKDNEEREIDIYCNKIAMLTGLSSNTIYRIVSIYEQTKGKTYTINELAEIYGTSIKNMYSIIAKLEEKGYVSYGEKKIHNNLGRPSRLIIFHFFD